MNRSILIFVSITYALSISLGLVARVYGTQAVSATGLGLIAMFVPSLTVVILRFTLRESVASIGWNRFPLRYLPLALFMIPFAMHAAMLPTTAVLAGGLPWQEWLTPQADGLYHTPAARAWGTLTTQGLITRIAINAGVGLVVVSFLAFFEEVGWRAWLLPRLVKRMGVRKGVVATSIIWAFWHLPFALSGIQHIDGVSALAIPLGIIAPGMVIGWFWVRTESIWIVSLAHGALNNWGQYAFKYMQDSVAADPSIVLASGGAALLLIGSLLLLKALPAGLEAPRSEPLIVAHTDRER